MDISTTPLNVWWFYASTLMLTAFDHTESEYIQSQWNDANIWYSTGIAGSMAGGNLSKAPNQSIAQVEIFALPRGFCMMLKHRTRKVCGSLEQPCPSNTSRRPLLHFWYEHTWTDEESLTIWVQITLIVQRAMWTCITLYITGKLVESHDRLVITFVFICVSPSTV